MEGVRHRRSARILALDICKQSKAPPDGVRKTENGAMDGKGIGSGQGVYRRKRGRKRKKLMEVEEVSFNSVAKAVGKAGQNVDHWQTPGESSSSALIMPEKQVLELIIDALQKKDTHEVFAEPVDPEEVEGYYDIIKDPMDFGTMRAKLQEGIYETLEEFEKDVFLICSNAMLFNSSTSLYFRQARSIQELAKKAFHALRTDPENFEMEFSTTKRRYYLTRAMKSHGNGRSQADAGSSAVKSSNAFAINDRQSSLQGHLGLGRNLQAGSVAGGSALVENQRILDPSATREGRKCNLREEDRRFMNRPWTSFLNSDESIASTVYDGPKQLFYVNQDKSTYEESLLRFVKDLGPTAQKVARRKLENFQNLAWNSRSPELAPSERAPTASSNAFNFSAQPPSTVSSNDFNFSAQPPSTASSSVLNFSAPPSSTASSSVFNFLAPPSSPASSSVFNFSAQKPSAASSSFFNFSAQPPSTASSSAFNLSPKLPSTASSNVFNFFAQPPSTASSSVFNFSVQPPSTTSSSVFNLSAQLPSTASSSVTNFSAQPLPIASSSDFNFSAQPLPIASSSDFNFSAQPTPMASSRAVNFLAHPASSASTSIVNFPAQLPHVASGSVIKFSASPSHPHSHVDASDRNDVFSTREMFNQNQSSEFPSWSHLPSTCFGNSEFPVTWISDASNERLTTMTVDSGMPSNQIQSGELKKWIPDSSNLRTGSGIPSKEIQLSGVKKWIPDSSNPRTSMAGTIMPSNPIHLGDTKKCIPDSSNEGLKTMMADSGMSSDLIQSSDKKKYILDSSSEYLTAKTDGIPSNLIQSGNFKKWILDSSDEYLTKMAVGSGMQSNLNQSADLMKWIPDSSNEYLTRMAAGSEMPNNPIQSVDSNKWIPDSSTEYLMRMGADSGMQSNLIQSSDLKKWIPDSKNESLMRIVAGSRMPGNLIQSGDSKKSLPDSSNEYLMTMLAGSGMPSNSLQSVDLNKWIPDSSNQCQTTVVADTEMPTNAHQFGEFKKWIPDSSDECQTTMMVGSGIPNNLVQSGDMISSEVSQSKLFEFMLRNNNDMNASSPSAWPFQAMKSPGPSQAPDAMHGLCSHTFDAENQATGMVLPELNQRVGSVETGQCSSWTRPELWGAQSDLDMSYLQSSLSGVNSWGGRNEIPEQDLPTTFVAETMFLDSMGGSDRDVGPSHRVPPSTQDLFDKHPDLALQL